MLTVQIRMKYVVGIFRQMRCLRSELGPALLQHPTGFSGSTGSSAPNAGWSLAGVYQEPASHLRKEKENSALNDIS